MARTRSSKQLSVEDSWRMVEGGDNDSFDTAIVQDPFEGDALVFSSQSQPSQPYSSQDFSVGSQDSIHDFYDRADEDNVIRRAPFQPSLTPRNVSMDKDRTPVPEFFMPAVDVESPPRNNRRSSRTTHPVMQEPRVTRRRGNRQVDNDPTPRKPGTQHDENSAPPRPSLSTRFISSAPEFLFDFASWVLGTIRLAFRYAQWPIAIMLAIYLIIGVCIMAKDMLVNSLTAPLAPLCRVPGVSLMNLPFCPDNLQSGKGDGSSPVEFEELMNVQSQFEKVLEDSAQGISLPMDMKRSEASVRDLRTMVKFSELPTRAELVHEFDNYIEAVRVGADDLQMFNTHVGSAVDSVISINRWTSRYIDSIALNREANDNMLSRFSGWLFSPFQSPGFDEHVLLEKYIEHTAMVADKIQTLILEGTAVMRLLHEAEGSLELINEHVVHTGNVVKEKHNEVFWNVWTLVGANTRRLHNLKGQLSLLQQVETQRHSAVRQLGKLIHDLTDIRTKLSDLRDRVAAPELLADTTDIPLTVHIETINAGVERLEASRSRIRAEENERLQQAIQRSREDDRLIEG
ncbi:uncharacterized protein F4807DRAFT_427646 [Annulohypoxylon truncatum]|uniref:uncharacterized protein n=1 Tax=Annulohypoxylon truncatum TaxID=327061 RepID=UPI0020076A75|nr:uncharacterized protein F4807DRAFT_427646 [Annulohypoxylon truncatum]KAI1209232.1 hypothetical protein F4807DRAFT_427646 [Annulohypoxylon truncatum]